MSHVGAFIIGHGSCFSCRAHAKPAWLLVSIEIADIKSESIRSTLFRVIQNTSP